MINFIKYLLLILLILIYPFWFFFSNTWIGNILTMISTLFPLPYIISIIFPSLMQVTGQKAETLGISIASLTLISAMPIGTAILLIGDSLHASYERRKFMTSFTN